ncbi:hypothetical protein MRX96_025623 [Rhipicephalus microplus]
MKRIVDLKVILVLAVFAGLGSGVQVVEEVAVRRKKKRIDGNDGKRSPVAVHPAAVKRVAKDVRVDGVVHVVAMSPRRTRLNDTDADTTGKRRSIRERQEAQRNVPVEVHKAEKFSGQGPIVE